MSRSTWASLNRSVEGCRKCDRLIEHCRHIAKVKRKAYADQKYWGKPVVNLGQLPARLLVIGLAPGAHGANRTGRMFTGDRSGDWLFRALHRAGFANQPLSTDRQDGLKLADCVVTNICRCAPPDNKPSSEEVKQCEPFFNRTIEFCQPVVFLALGGLAWKSTIKWAIENNHLPPIKPRPKFAHGAELELSDNRWLIGSYHPSQQNTFTGRLTEPMFDRVFKQARKKIDRYERRTPASPKPKPKRKA